MTGFRVKEEEMRHWGMTLPGLSDRAHAIAELPALGLLTLAGQLPEGWTCSYHPMPGIDLEPIERIASQNPTLVAVSALTASIEEAYRLSSQLRSRKIQTVIGGLHATACPDESERFFDAVAVGSGEPVWPELLADAEKHQLANRYSASDFGSFHWSQPRLDLLGCKPPRYTLQTQRGCPFACEFCGASRMLGRFRAKPLELIRRELAAISAVSPRPLLELADDNSFAGDRDCNPLLELFRESGARWFTESDWLIGERPHLLARLAACGCKQVLVGIESLVFRYPGQGQKEARLNRIMEAVHTIQESGVVVNGCFIVGADGETRESLDRLARFVLDSPLAEVQITVQTPFPGTGLHRRLERQGRLLEDRGWSHYTLFDVTFQPDLMSVQELETGFRELLGKIYSAEATQKRASLRRRIWRQAKDAR